MSNDERMGLGYVPSHPRLSRRTHTIDRNRFIPHKQEPKWLISQVPYESHLIFNAPDRWVGSVRVFLQLFLSLLIWCKVVEIYFRSDDTNLSCMFRLVNLSIITCSAMTILSRG